MSDEDEESERVGYGRPPKHSQFKPGVSGNPKGRRKGTVGFASLVSRELNTKATVVEGGRRRTVSKREALAKRTVLDALGGNKEARALVIASDRQTQETLVKVASALISEQDDLARENLARRITEFVLPRSEPEDGEGDQCPVA